MRRAKQNEIRSLNTQINYLYRDADNYKVHNQCVISGTLFKEQQALILSCLEGGMHFIPSLVGLPEEKFDEVDDPEVDHPWFELYEEDFAETTRKPTVPITADELVAAFRKCKDKWMDIYLGTAEMETSIKKVIRGVECQCYEYSDPMHGGSGTMRMQLEGTFGENVNQDSMILVPLSLTEAELEIIADLWLTEQERELGLPLGESCTSSGWWVGSADPSKDALITDEYDFLIPIALANKQAQEQLQHEIDAFYQKQEKIEQALKLEYKDGETDWAVQLEVKSEELERLIADKEELLEQSRLLSIGNTVAYNGYYCEVIHIENNVVYLQDNSSDLHFEVHASKYLNDAQLVPEEEKTAPLEFILFDDEIMVSEDMTKLEGYLWAVSSLVDRLKKQEPPLEEDQFMENINFYPVYDVLNGMVSIEGHYYLEDAHYATGKGFTLPLTSEESARLIDAFESYCKKREGKSCLEFLNQIREQEGTEHVLPRPSLVNQIEAASDRTAEVRPAAGKAKELSPKR